MSGGEGTISVEHFGSLKDPGRPQGRRHNLPDIAAMTICAGLEPEARRLLGAARSNWGIENSVHGVPDVSFREYESRVRSGNAPENLATMRRAALNLLRRDRHSKRSVKAKRKLAAWDNDYLLSILSD